MPKLTKTVVDKADPRDRQYTVWCSDLKGFGVFVLSSGTRTYFVDYRNANNVRRRMKLGRHGTVTAEQARTLAIQALADVAKGNDPLEDRNSARKAISVKELCELYMAELEAGRILGKGGRPKKASTKITDLGRITRHIIPLLGSKRVTHVTKADVTAMMKDIMGGKTRMSEKTKKLRGKSIVRGGLGAASRTVGLLGGIFTYARDELGIIEANPAHGVRKPKDAVRKRRLNEEEYRTLGRGHSLKFDDERRDDSPFVPEPFPAVPGGMNPADGPEVRMRAPTLWAALNLAAKRPDGSTPSVLISLTQNIDTFAATCADLMDKWQDIALPDYWSIEEGNEIWARCLATAIDYFTANSVEYRLLARGIVVHHGKMPGLLARRLKTVIDRGYVRVIIATSTLSEGVNIPVNFLLIPSVFRSNGELPLQEFSNLIGRAGRPGVATEGSALVVLPERTYENRFGQIVPTYNRQWNGYESLVAQLEAATAAVGDLIPDDQASSPLAHLLRELERAWRAVVGGGTEAEFIAWLEQTAVTEQAAYPPSSHDYLDSLDAFLIAAIQEVEELKGIELDAAELEAELAKIWRRTYAHAASHGEAHLATVWLARGRAIKAQYPDADERRRLYKTSLTPRSAKLLLDRAEAIRVKLSQGADYARWTVEEQFVFIRDVLAFLSEIPVFAIESKLGRKKKFDNWPMLLRWWLAKSTLAQQPRPNEVTNWYAFVANNFIYRGTWGLGSVIGLLLDTTDDGQPIRALEIADWPMSGLPWIGFWLKELISWGTLDPVAAFLLARGDAVDRPQAELDAKAYYEGRPAGEDANTLLDPRTIRAWVEARQPARAGRTGTTTIAIEVECVRPIEAYRQQRLVVLPLVEVDVCRAVTNQATGAPAIC